MRNVYGETLGQGIDGRGVDIAVQRADDLDKMALDYLGTLTSPAVLDVGCGAGGQSVRMAQAGTFVTGYDLFDFSDDFARAREENPLLNLEFVRGDLTDMGLRFSGKTFDVALSQRTFHYVRYAQACSALQALRRMVTHRLFISFSGLGAEFGAAYPDRCKPVEERFALLSPDMRDKHHIQQPLCLYTVDDARGLLERAGWDVETAYASAFGNIKLVGR